MLVHNTERLNAWTDGHNFIILLRPAIGAANSIRQS